MRLAMVTLAALLALTVGSEAVTLRPYTPGGSPCAGACGYEWARDQFQVPEGVPERMVIPQGSIVTQMSYAKDGVPYTFSESAILMEDEPGQGYFFEVDSQTYMMVQLDACQNWAVMLPPVQGLSYAPDAPVDYLPVGYSPSGWDGGFWGGGRGGGGCWNCGGGGTEPPPPPPCCEPPPAVPLPLSIWALLSALAALICLKRIANRR
jgi:hypothetical protein